MAIKGDFTDWVRVNMMQYTVSEIEEDPVKKNTFYITLKLTKNYRYRYLLYSDGVEFYDSDMPNSKNHQDVITNFIEVPGDDMTIQDIFH